ncbi:MAG: sugar ABC transporter permease [Deltaproteobacteria bacterium]|nr:sugar ABC transporter permease [Deltaproteobacteria bacterium]
MARIVPCRAFYLLLAPALMLLLLVLVLPLLATVYFSLFSGSLVAPSLGVPGENYLRLGSDPNLARPLINTLIFAGLSVILELFLGLAAALALNATPLAGGPCRALALLPWALPTAVMAAAWRLIYNDTYGLLNRLLMDLRLLEGGKAWLATPVEAFISVILADVWKTTPFVALILLAGLKTIPAELYEAMRLEGAGPFSCSLRITLPLLRPYLVLAVVFRVIAALGIFDLVWVMTGGGPANATQMLALYIYDQVFRYLDLGYGATLTIFMAVLLLLVVLLLLRLRPRESYYSGHLTG